MADMICDVAVIGAGTAGRSAERSARRHGARTLLIDEAFSGTTCVANGCMPSKLLIAAGEAAHAVVRSRVFGIEPGPLRIDGRRVMERVRRERDAFLASDLQSIEALPAGIAVKAKARFAGPNRLALDTGDEVRARAIVIATGSYPAVPDAFRPVAGHVLTNETVFELADLPSSLAVVGAGALGLELAQAFARLGVAVAVFDQGDAIAGLTDRRVEADLRAILQRDFAIHTGVDLSAEADGNQARLSWTGTGGARHAKNFERVLVATGRPPRLHELDLEKSGIVLDDHGTPRFHRASLQCGDAPVFIAGDADHDRPVLHEASDEGTIAGRNAARFPAVEANPRFVPFALTFTDPNVAVIGRVPDEGEGILTGTASYADQGRAKVMARNAGTVRFYAEPGSGRLVGASMAGPAVEHMAHLIAWAIEQGRTAHDLLDMPFYHPTFEEGLKPALRAICRSLNSEGSSRDQARPSAP